MTTTHDAATSLEHKVGPRGKFTLRQASGDIVIRGVEGDRIRVRSTDDKALSDVFDVDLGDDHVTLDQRDKPILGKLLSRRGGGLDLAVEVPHGATIFVESASADIVASDLSGPKRFRTASGEVSLARLAGGVDVETVSGEIEIDGQAPLDLIAKSVSGDASVRVPSVRRLDLGTTSGDIRLDAALSGDGPFAIRSISGDATVIGRNGFRVEAESITGDLSSDLPSKRVSMPGRKVLEVGRPGPTLSFRSVSGDFHVAQPRDAAPEVDSDVVPAPAEAKPTSTGTAPGSGPAAGSGPADDQAETGQLAILRALERGDIDVAEATERLATLDEVLR